MPEPRKASSNATTSRTAKQRAQYQRPTTSVKTDHSGKGAINAGLTAAQHKAVTAWENRNRNYKTEHTVLIDENGTVNPRGPIQLGSGTSKKARVNPYALVPNGVLTHNHPSNNVGIAGRVGVPLSGADIKLAAKYNLSEVRAVTPNYTFSIRRPAGGWKVNPDVLNAEFNSIANREARGMAGTTTQLLQRSGGITRLDADIYNNRVNTLASHRAIQELARKYGFTYTRRRTS